MQTQTEDVERRSEREREIIEDLSPEATVKRVFLVTMPDGNERRVEYVQATLGLFPTQEFLMMMQRIIKDFMNGKYGITVGDLFAASGDEIRNKLPENFDSDSIDGVFRENESIIRAVLNAIEIVPGFEQDVIALSLGVHPDERERFKKLISDAPHRGGLTIDEGVDIIKVFIRQNVRSIRRFLERQTREIYDEIAGLLAPKEKTETESKAIEPSISSLGSTPSSTSLPATLASE